MATTTLGPYGSWGNITNSAAPQSLASTIPSYLYVQYNDDMDLQAFVSAYNTLTQEYVDWFNQIVLPVYTSDTISGSLLDWVAEGLYGISRQILPYGASYTRGPYNANGYNYNPYNALRIIRPTSYYDTTDDIFKRIITWHFYKGDGKQFTIPWLKRRIARFLFGTNGVDPGIDQTYQVGVTVGDNRTIYITLYSGFRTIQNGAFYRKGALNSIAYDAVETVYTPLQPLIMAPIFKAAVESGALELPFQYQFIVNID